MKPVVSVIFSKNRAMQLRATLDSFFLHCKDLLNVKVCVLYTTSEECYEKQYSVLKVLFPTVVFVREKNLIEDLVCIVGCYDYLLMQVDDNVYVRDFYIADVTSSLRENPSALGFSLRLGSNIQGSYMARRMFGKHLPHFVLLSRDMQKWAWTDSWIMDEFKYPLEVSSSVYRQFQILPLIEKITEKTVNGIESYLNRSRGCFQDSFPDMLSFSRSVVLAVPINKVQTCRPNNRSSTEVNYSVEALAKLFSDGWCVDVKALSGFIPVTPHQEMPLPFCVEASKLGVPK